MTVGDILFRHHNGTSLADWLRSRVDGLGACVDLLSDESFANQDDERLAATVAAEAAIRSLDVEFDKENKDVQVTTLNRPDGFGSYMRVNGLLATKHSHFGAMRHSGT